MSATDAAEEAARGFQLLTSRPQAAAAPVRPASVIGLRGSKEATEAHRGRSAGFIWTQLMAAEVLYKISPALTVLADRWLRCTSMMMPTNRLFVVSTPQHEPRNEYCGGYTKIRFPFDGRSTAYEGHQGHSDLTRH